MNINILKLDSVGSTNSEAAEQARRGAAEGVCVVADEQTAGRGRYGRTWVSERGSGLYFSIVLRPELERERFGLITLMAGVAVSDTLKHFGIDADIKWVNDLLVDDRKIGGILAEAIETPTGTAVIVGIGINLRDVAYPVGQASTSIETELDRIVERDEIIGVLTEALSRCYDLLNSPDGANAILDEWRQRSTWFSGKSVRATLVDGVIEGTTDGLEPDGALRVKLADDSISIVQAGDIERLRERY